VAGQELRDLWLGNRGPLILLIYSILLGAQTFLVASDAQLNLLDAREATAAVTKLALSVGALAVLIIAADAISGERERNTLEHLLLTPLRRRDLVIGKLIAAISVWWGAMVLSIPYVVTVADAPGITADAVWVVIAVGTLVATALAGLGIAVSSVARSNRSSLAISVITILALAAPGQLPASSTRGLLGDILVRANPIAAGLRLNNNILIDERAWSSQWPLLVAPAVGALVMVIVAVSLWRRVGLGGGR
jgi:ABC-2 type transport system permease protein